MGLGHIWACGQKSGRHCMKQHVEGASLSHASWAMRSPAKERVRKKRAEKAAQEAAAPAAASRAQDCPVSPSVRRSPRRNTAQRRLTSL
eukprot:1699298-Pleurochrysis_carterae.AAC.1